MAEDSKKGAEGTAPNIDIKALQDEIASLKKDVTAKDKELADAAKIVADLKAKIADLKDGGGTEKVIATVDGKKYHITAAMRTKEGVLQPEDIAADKELIKKLLKKGSGIVTRV